MSDSIMVSVIARYTQGVLNSFTQIYYYYESSLPVSFKQYYMVDYYSSIKIKASNCLKWCLKTL